jgi:membrane protease YdiL (CAAX protease family)
MISLIILLLFLTIPIFYYRIIKEKSWTEIKKTLFPKYKGHKIEIIGSIKLFIFLIIGFIIIATTINFLEIISNTQISDMENVAEFVISGFGTNAIIFLILIIIVVFIEEFFFRAFLVKRTGILFSTIIFTFFHLGYESITQTIGVFFLGLILAYWFKKHNSIIQNYFGHLLYNLLAITLYIMMV